MHGIPLLLVRYLTFPSVVRNIIWGSLMINPTTFRPENSDGMWNYINNDVMYFVDITTAVTQPPRISSKLRSASGEMASFALTYDRSILSHCKINVD
jgi:hypothetical protein